ncbi:MAG: thioredoxin [Acholeplasmatales bacterium]|nr:thioredoxin [Acholeplasmatales bacterium]
MIVNGTKDNFNTEVLASKLPVILDFGATWCPPCKKISELLDEIDAELNGQVKIVKVDVDEEHELAEQYKVHNIPTVVIYKNGRVVAATVGDHPKESILKLLKM